MDKTADNEDQDKGEYASRSSDYKDDFTWGRFTRCASALLVATILADL